MRRTPLFVGCIVVIACAFALEAFPQAEVRETGLTWKQVAVGDGAKLYAELCASCHGADATGNGPAAQALATPVPNLTLLALANGGEFPTFQVQRSIAGDNRTPAHEDLQMPKWEQEIEDLRPDRKVAQREGIARSRISDLTSYLETLQTE